MNIQQLIQSTSENTYYNKQLRIKKLFPLIKKIFKKHISPIEATKILEIYTNVWDSDSMVEQQLNIAINEGKIVIDKE